MYIWIDHLQKVRLLNVLMLEGKGVSVLQKPDKIYLENSNLSYTLRHSPNKGSVRETFALNQLLNSGHRVTLPKSGDFQVDDIIIEVGEKSKTGKQVEREQPWLVAADDMESGFGKKVPLWMFGFLY